MADRHPKVALEYLRNCDEQIGNFYRNRMEPDTMISYTIRRLWCVRPSLAFLLI